MHGQQNIKKHKIAVCAFTIKNFLAGDLLRRVMDRVCSTLYRIKFTLFVGDFYRMHFFFIG
jgi:hypothetical protein